MPLKLKRDTSAFPEWLTAATKCFLINAPLPVLYSIGSRFSWHLKLQSLASEWNTQAKMPR